MFSIFSIFSICSIYQLFNSLFSGGAFFIIDDIIQVCFLGQDDLFLERCHPFFLARIAIIHRNIPQWVNPKNLSEFLYTLSSKRIMTFACSLGHSRTNILNISINGYSLQLWIVILNDPIKTNIITIILLNYIVSHLLYLEKISVIEIHEVTTNEGQTNQTDVEHIVCLSSSILETRFKCIFIVSWSIGHYRANRAYCIISPDLKSSH